VTEKLTIDTPEQIALDYVLAGVGSRCLALSLDTLIQAATMVILLLIVSGVSALQATLGGTPDVWPLAVGLLLGFVVFYGYFAIFEVLWRGQTPGKRVVGLRVIAATGHPVTAQAALLRNLVRVADSLPAVYAIGVLTMLITERSQRLGDLAAGTVVVHERPIAHHDTAVELSGGARVGGSRLREDEFEVVATFLRRRQDLPWEVRERAALDIASRLRRTLELPEGGSDEELLERAAAEYRAGRAYR